MPQVVSPRVDYDPAHGDVVRCWVCRQPWPTRFDMVLDSYHSELRIDGRPLIRLRPSEANVLAVLINNFPRWLPRSQLVELAYDYLPDVDMPSPSSVTNAIKLIKDRLKGTRYVIQHDNNRGWRLSDEDTINREVREERAQMPKSSKAGAMSIISMGAARKTPGATPDRKPRHRKKDNVSASQTAGRVKLKAATKVISTKNQMRKKKRTVKDV